MAGQDIDIPAWLRGLGLERYAQAFRDAELTAEALPELTDADLRELGLPLGPRRVVLKAVRGLAGPPGSAPAGAPVASVAERRQLTVLFADLVGSTALSGRLDPEDMREVLRSYQDAVAGAVVRFGGHVAKFLGDGVLAYFGWPQAYEDQAERAVRAGLAVVEAVPRLATPAGEPLAARVGIASGLVVVGDLVGEGGAWEEAVVGETPNLAARLQEMAEPGAVVVADGTRRLLGGVFELRELGATRLKGFERPVPCFRVTGERPGQSRFEARQPSGSAPMVGRDQELALVLERWRQAVSGEGQAVLLVGEAGIGKSRLVRAVLDAAGGEAHAAARYQCSPHHTGTALWPVAQQLAFAADLAPADDGAGRLEKLEALLRQGAEDVAEAAPLIAALLGVDPGDRYPVPDISPQQRRARTLAALVGQLLGLARRRGPVLMVLEDAHWADPTTLELVGLALDRIAGARVLMLLTSRPDGQPTLGGHPHVTRLTLNRLGRGPTEAMVARLASGRDLPPAVLGEIAARTDGVPLFVEELTKAVLEAGTTGAGPTVPVSLYASLMARLDRVPGVKEVAQAAACIGREFGYELLVAASRLPKAELCVALERLVAAELVFARGEPPEASYAFKHALVRDAAHESLLMARRRELHARIAEVIEERFPETAEAEPELLARHCAEAGLRERAVDHWLRAGRQALARSATAEAVAHLTKGLEALGGLPEGVGRQRRELGLQLALGQASLAARGLAAPDAGRAYARARELCRELGGDVPEFFPALYGRFVVHFQRGEFGVAQEAARELLRLAQERGDDAARVTGHRNVGAVLYCLGRWAESRAQLEEGLALYEPGRDRSSALVYAVDSRVVCLSWLAHVLFALGYPEQAGARTRAALADARELEHPHTLAAAVSTASSLHCRHQTGPQVRTEAEELIALATEQGFPLLAAEGTVAAGWALAGEGADEEGIARMRRGLADYRATGAAIWVPDFLSLLAQAQGQAGRPVAGLDLLTEALEWVEETGGRWLEAELHRLKGELLLTCSDQDQTTAEACFSRALAVAREQGAKMWELRAATSLARLWREQERCAEAHDLLAPIYRWFTEGLDTPDLVEARSLLGELGNHGH